MIADVVPTCSQRVPRHVGRIDIIVGVLVHMDRRTYLRLASLPTFLGPAPFRPNPIFFAIADRVLT